MEHQGVQDPQDPYSEDGDFLSNEEEEQERAPSEQIACFSMERITSLSSANAYQH